MIGLQTKRYAANDRAAAARSESDEVFVCNPISHRVRSDLAFETAKTVLHLLGSGVRCSLTPYRLRRHLNPYRSRPHGSARRAHAPCRASPSQRCTYHMYMWSHRLGSDGPAAMCVHKVCCSGGVVGPVSLSLQIHPQLQRGGMVNARTQTPVMHQEQRCASTQAPSPEMVAAVAEQDRKQQQQQPRKDMPRFEASSKERANEHLWASSSRTPTSRCTWWKR